MKIGIMQPYFFPYIGYWQLINVVDKYIVYDDVNFIKGGWINRNRILLEGKAHFLNLQMKGASSNKLINEIEREENSTVLRKRMGLIEGAYSKAPMFLTIYPLIEQIIMNPEKNIAQFLFDSIKLISEYLEIKTEMILSSSLDKNNDLKGQEKVMEICKILNATEYYNASGGMELYSQKAFEQKDIKLNFLYSNVIEYVQFGNAFVENLSIIDVLMFNTQADVKNMLTQFEIL